MKSLDFIEQLYNRYFFDDPIDMIFRNGGTGVARIMWAAVVNESGKRGILLTDIHTFDYAPVLENIYDTSEKGLS
jgi:hypothetical protein